LAALKLFLSIADIDGWGVFYRYYGKK